MRDSWVVYCRTQSRHILHRFYGKGTKVLGPIRRVRFTSATLRHANIRENKGPSPNEIQVKLPHQRSPYALKFEERSQEETERQERCARGDAWRLAKNILKEKLFFSPTNEWSLPAPSTVKPEEREFVVDSGASMHMVSRKDLNFSRIGNRKTLTIRRRLLQPTAKC